MPAPEQVKIIQKLTILISYSTYQIANCKYQQIKMEIPINIKNEKRFGTLTFALDKGLYIINTKFEDTQIRKLGKLITLVSFLIIILLIFNNLIKHVIKNIIKLFP